MKKILIETVVDRRPVWTVIKNSSKEKNKVWNIGDIKDAFYATYED